MSKGTWNELTVYRIVSGDTREGLRHIVINKFPIQIELTTPAGYQLGQDHSSEVTDKHFDLDDRFYSVRLRALDHEDSFLSGC